MPDYDFRSLSPPDFEHLSRDVLNADLGLRLQSYPAGRDKGIDLRQADAGGQTIVGQCKHYVESSQSTFLTAVAKEGRRSKSLKADRYLFVTSRPITAHLQEEIQKKLTGLPVAKDDIWGREALNAALGRHPDVERRHIKLWISSTEVMDALLRSGQWQRGEAMLAQAAERARRWVHTPAYEAVLDILETEGVCILSGPPGVGKSFLAEMALLATAQLGWQVIHVADNIQDAWSALHTDDSPQIFYYDDFLGSSCLELASKSEASSLNGFITRIRQFKHAKRLILTTREQFINEAADGSSDQMAELARQPGRFSLRMQAYGLDTRAQILFNHLYFSALPPAERNRLSIDNRLISIVKHPSYSPRLVDIGVRFSPAATADEVMATIRRALENPADVWKGSFRSLSALERQVLLTLATLPPRPWPVDVIRDLVAPADALSWKPALHTLETTWLGITGEATSRLMGLANPGCRDYLLGVLDETAVALDQLDRVRLLPQLVSLTQSAGLTEQPYPRESAPARAELAATLTGQRDRLLLQLQQFTKAALASAPGLVARTRPLLEAAIVLKALGPADPAAWFLDLVADHVGMQDGQATTMPVVDGFALAEIISQLPAYDLDRQHLLAKTAALTAAQAIAALHDLDAFETLPDELKLSPELQATIRVRAQIAIEFEYNQLLDTALEADEVETSAHDLRQRAQYYGVPLEVGPLLDRADDLRQEASNLSDWPNADGSDDDSEDGMDLHQIFVQLRTD